MSRRTSILGLLLLASYVLAAAVPCRIEAPERAPARAHAATRTHDHSAHQPGSSDSAAQWTAPCPCSCGNRGATSVGGGKLGTRLISSAPDPELPPCLRPLVAVAPRALRAPFSPVEPIPI